MTTTSLAALTALLTVIVLLVGLLEKTHRRSTQLPRPAPGATPDRDLQRVRQELLGTRTDGGVVATDAPLWHRCVGLMRTIWTKATHLEQGDAPGCPPECLSSVAAPR